MPASRPSPVSSRSAPAPCVDYRRLRRLRQDRRRRCGRLCPRRSIVGPEASELIAELGLAIELGATLEDVASTVHTHPTLSEAVMEPPKTRSATRFTRSIGNPITGRWNYSLDRTLDTSVRPSCVDSHPARAAATLVRSEGSDRPTSSSTLTVRTTSTRSRENRPTRAGSRVRFPSRARHRAVRTTSRREPVQA